MNIAKHLPTFAIMLVLMLQPASAKTISLAGSTTVQKYIRLAAQAYSSAHSEVFFSIHWGGSTAGIAQVVDKRIRIGMLSRELTAREKHALVDVQQITIALDAVVPIVSPEIYEAGVQKIRPEALAQIYRGQMRNWKQLEGPDRRIMVVDKNIYHGTRAIFANYVLGPDSADEPSESFELDSDDDVMRLIMSSDQAIGYVGIGYLEQGARVLSIETDGKSIDASQANIRSGTYPLSRKLYLIIAKNAPAYVQKFVSFVLSPQGQRLVRRAGYLPITELPEAGQKVGSQ